MSPRFRRAALVLICLLVGTVAIAFGWARSRKIPLRKVFSPAQWVLHWQGRDRYDPRQALLQEGDPNRREVALTFDDGPDTAYGPQIAAILKEKNVPATFFLVGMRVKQHPEVARLLAQDGFELANHTYNHQDLPALKPHEIANELRLCDADVYAATGGHTTLMRPPGVQYNDKVLDVAKSLGYVTVSWTVGARDYETDTTSDFIKDRVLDRAAPGSDHPAAPGHARHGAALCPPSSTRSAPRATRSSRSARCWTTWAFAAPKQRADLKLLPCPSPKPNPAI